MSVSQCFKLPLKMNLIQITTISRQGDKIQNDFRLAVVKINQTSVTAQKRTALTIQLNSEKTHGEDSDQLSCIAKIFDKLLLR